MALRVGSGISSLFWQVWAHAERLPASTNVAARTLKVYCFIKVRYSGLFEMLWSPFQMHAVSKARACNSHVNISFERYRGKWWRATEISTLDEISRQVRG